MRKTITTFLKEKIFCFMSKPLQIILTAQAHRAERKSLFEEQKLDGNKFVIRGEVTRRSEFSEEKEQNGKPIYSNNSNERLIIVSSGMLRRVALVRTDVSEEPSASFIRVTRIDELGTTQAATNNRRTLRRNTDSCHPDEGGSKRRFLQDPHGVTSQKTPFFIVTAVKTSNLT
jgi:hypothetical protein